MSVLLLVVTGGGPGHRWWIKATALSAGWVFAGVGFGRLGWARTAVPAAAFTAFALFYLVDHRFDAVAATLLLAASLASSAHVLSIFRAQGRRTRVEPNRDEPTRAVSAWS